MKTVIRSCLFVVPALLALPAAHAAMPASGTLSPTTPTLTYTSGPFNDSNQTAINGYTADPSAIVCNNMTGAKRVTPCDDFALTVSIPAAYLAAHPNVMVKISTAWTPSSDDFDIYLLDSSGTYVGSANGTDDPEQISFAPAVGSSTFTARIVPGTVSGENTTTTITLVPGDSSGGGGTAQPPLPPNPTGAGVPRYRTYLAPNGFGDDAGEPSIGYNTATKRAMMIAATQTLQINFPQSASPARPAACDADWKDVSYLLTNKTTLDPILFTDFNVGRTFVSQLNSVIGASAANVGLNSYYAYTDDDGASWTPGQIGPPEGGYDHQTTGSGPYPATFAALANPSVNKGIAVYYCSQGGVDAFCARSDTGGLTFGNGVLAWTLNDCGGLHGHVRVAPDGTAYVPNNGCSGLGLTGTPAGSQGAAVSTDAGTSWTIRRAPGSTEQANGTDPSVGIAKDNTVYYCYVNGDGHPHVAVSNDRMVTFTSDVDIGKGMNIAHADFPQAIAGDSDRAACAFIGTTSSGNDQAYDFPGTWYGFIATTYDHGKTWTTINVTPNKPVQRESGIWNQGGSVPQRNLLDFNEISIDERGAPVFGFADGCIGPCEITGPNTFSAKASIVRQTGGKTLYKQFDGVEPAAPAPSCLAGQRDTQGSYLTWLPPDNGGSDITNYKIYRGTASGQETYLGITGNKLAYNDRAADPNVPTYYYKITGTNAQGEGVYSNIVPLPIAPLATPETTCALPGVTVVDDPAGDTVSGMDAVDLTRVSIAEPQASDGKLIFVFKVKGGLTDPLPQNTRWAILFNGPAAAPGGAEAYHVSMITDAGQTTFVYGTEQFFSEAGQSPPGAPFTSGRQFTDTGALDGASGFAADGTIKLIAPMSLFGLKRGDVLNVIVTRVSQGTPATGSGSYRSVLQDSGGGGAYTLRSATFCLPQTAPTARITASTERGIVPLTVQFDGSTSSDPDAVDTVASYTFNFGDGSDEVTQSTATITHQFTQTGLYPVKLVVNDSRGLKSTNTAQVLVDVQPVPAANTAPTASLASNASSGTRPLMVTFDGSRSSDPDAGDSIASYRFDFGDGSAVVSQAGPTISHSYTANGNYTASLTVTDSRGLVSANTSTVQITVTEPAAPNTAPTARLVADRSSGDRPLTVSFDGSTSTDPDSGDRVASYRFDFGDGSAVLTQAGANAQHTYDTAGRYTATLTVMDTHGLASASPASVGITATEPVVPPPANTPPVAAITSDVSTVTRGATVNFDASGSRDADAGDRVVSYAFNFGDGSPTVTQTTAQIGHLYAKSGSYTTSVVVTDTHGATSAPATTTVTVVDPIVPVVPGTAPAPQPGRLGGGALGLVLLPLAGVVALRRRRRRH